MAKEKIGISTTKRGIKGILWSFTGSFVNIVAQFLVIGILARLLTPEEFGIVGVILIFVNFSKRFTDMGIATALIQLSNISNKHISAGYTVSVFIGIIVGLIFYFSAPVISGFFNLSGVDDAIHFFAIFFPLVSFNGVTRALLTRKLKYSVIVKCGMISYIFGIGITSIILAYMDFGYWSLIIGQFSGLVVSLFTMIYYEPPLLSFRFDKKTVSELLVFGTGHTLDLGFNFLGENADNIVIGRTIGTTALGIYSKAFQLFSIPAGFVGRTFDKVLLPILSSKKDEKEILNRFYLFTNSLSFGLFFPLSTLLFINAELIVKVLLGDQWLEVISLFQILILGLAYRFGTRINRSYFTALGIVYKGAFYQLAFAIYIFIFCAVGSYLYGLAGVAFGVLLATIINYLQTSYRLYKELDFKRRSFYEIHLKAIAFNITFIVLTYFLYFFQIRSIWIHLCLTLLVYAPIMIFVIQHKKNIILNEENFLMIAQILNFLPTMIQDKIKRINIFKKYF